MSEVSFGNIELPLEQKKFFFFSFHFCWCFCICERATLYECYSNYSWGYSINNNLQSLKLSIFRCSERWRWWHHPCSSCNDQRTYQREISQQMILPIHLLPFSNNLSSKKANTACSFPAQTFLCCYSGSSASGSGSTDCTTSFSTNSSRSV